MGDHEFWVYAGFDVTYKSLGVDFDAYYESNTYLLGKAFIDRGYQVECFIKNKTDLFGVISLMKAWMKKQF